jgi:P-type E1-E2 ATPase
MAELARRPSAGERAWIASLLAMPARRAPEGAAVEVAADFTYDARPGEAILVEPGEIVPVDVRVESAEVDVFPWAGAATSVRRRKGDAVVAGAEIQSGRLRGVCTAAGHDRAFARVLLDPRRRADALAPLARASRAVAERWAIVAAAIGALSSFVAGRLAVEVAMAAVAVHAALSTPLIASLAAVHVAHGILLGLRRGITYKSADAWDRVGAASAAAFCARGTLLLGEPELVEIESPGGKLDPAEILALAAAAERTDVHPIATAILRAARARGVRLEGVRNSNRHDGLGVTAITANGEDLCVGSRALLLEQRISIAIAEDRIAELEALGRTVVLVAVGARLAGFLSFQDGLRPGARAAVQHLLDEQNEPVLISGDARETCEAIARALDIEHIRPEVASADRAAEVKRIVDTGTSVAVIGHPGVDRAALAAGDVSVALAAAGAVPGDFDVALASDDVRDAALAVALARRTRALARAGVAIAVLPAVVGSVIVAFGLLPPAYAPLASLLGGVMALVHVRAQGRLPHQDALAPR